LFKRKNPPALLYPSSYYLTDDLYLGRKFPPVTDGTIEKGGDNKYVG